MASPAKPSVTAPPAHIHAWDAGKGDGSGGTLYTCACGATETVKSGHLRAPEVIWSSEHFSIGDKVYEVGQPVLVNIPGDPNDPPMYDCVVTEKSTGTVVDTFGEMAYTDENGACLLHLGW